MKVKKLFILLILIAIDLYAQLAPVDSILEGNINSNAVLSSSKKYLLRGFVNVNPPATLTIEPGTIIYGEKDSKGTLIINRGAKIIANGTKDRPIVFTSQQPVGQRGPGDWGGIIIAGNARINVPGGTATIEGGTGTVYGGGANPNDDDNSGILRYVRIEFPGIAFLPDNEINGLTLGGVGRGTTLEYIQVSYSGDDSFEWFGGNVNAKYLISYKCVDDDFDMDFGYSGNLQFGFSLREPNIADISGSNGFEIDNDGTGTYNIPRTLPIISNFTLVGPMPDTSFSQYNPNFKRGAHIRRAAQASIYNSVLMGYPVGLLLDGAAVRFSAVGDTLQIRNSIWAGLRAGNGIITNQQGFDAQGWFDTPAFGNRRFVQPSSLGLIDPFNLTNPNPVPSQSSPAASGASFSNPRLASPFFVQTTYVGAFDSNGPRWDEGWTNYNPQYTDYTTGVEEQYSGIKTFELFQNYPNPFNPSTSISFTLSENGKTTLKIFNSLGELIKTLVDTELDAGKLYSVNFDASGLPSGIYLAQLKQAKNSKIIKLVLIK